MPRSRLHLSPLGAVIAVILGLLIAVIVVGLSRGVLDTSLVAMGLIGLLGSAAFTHRGHPRDDDDRGSR